MSASRRTAPRAAATGLAPPPVAAAGGGSHRHGAPAGAFADEMHQAMQAMVRAMDTKMSGDPDADFLAMMIPHHQGAIEMARLVLVHGRDPLTRRLAEDIIASQQGEIASMEARLRILRSGPGAPEYPALSGTRG